MVIWIVGLAAAGKTSLCAALRRLLKPPLPSLVVIEGEDIRKIFGNDHGYTEEGRILGGKRLQGMAHILSAQGIPVVLACVYCRPELLDWNRKNLPDYFEIYLKASLETVMARDPKGLYREARAGRMPNVVGLDIPFAEPACPDLVIDSDRPEAPEAWALAVARKASGLKKYLSESALRGLGNAPPRPLGRGATR